MSIPTPSGSERIGVAAIVTNSGWPPGAITLNASDYGRWWQTADAAALEVNLSPGVSPPEGRRKVQAALARHPGLEVRTAGERIALSESSAHQGLRTLAEISTAAFDRGRPRGGCRAQRRDLAAAGEARDAEGPGL